MSDSEKDIVLDKALYWAVKDGIPYSTEKENFVDYLKKEKEIFDRPRPRNQIIFAVIFIMILVLILLYSILFTIQGSLEFLQGKFIGPEGYQSEFYTILILAMFFALILGLILSITFLGFRYFFTKDKWSRFHDQTLTLFERLQKNGSLDKYITFEEIQGRKRFKLIKLSVDFQFHWISPFIFDDFPPLLNEFMVFSFLLPFLISTVFSIFNAMVTSEEIVLIIMSLLLLLIFVGFYSNSKIILNSWRTYYWIRVSMINRQQELIHSLVLVNADNLFILRNQNNLARLESMPLFPVPSLLQISAIIPLLGSVLGYLIGLTIVI